MFDRYIYWLAGQEGWKLMLGLTIPPIILGCVIVLPLQLWLYHILT